MPAFIFADQLFYGGRFVQPIHCRKQPGQLAFSRVGSRVAGGPQAVKTRIDKQPPVNVEVFFITAVRTVFVFNLHHQDAAAMIDLIRCQLFAYGVYILFVFRQIPEILAPHGQSFFLLQPVGVTAKLPLGTDARRRPQNHPQTFFLCCTNKVHNVVVDGKIEPSFLRPLQVPENIGADGIQPYCFCHWHALAPGFLGTRG